MKYEKEKKSIVFNDVFSTRVSLQSFLQYMHVHLPLPFTQDSYGDATDLTSSILESNNHQYSQSSGS